MTDPQAPRQLRIPWSGEKLDLVILGVIVAMLLVELAARVVLPASQHELRERFLIERMPSIECAFDPTHSTGRTHS